jgi:DNA repair exonuclease SbcCD nuclease subunit
MCVYAIYSVCNRRMKILITADLHYREHWFRWLLSRAADYDLICIAGDLLDMFREEPRMEQARQVTRWIREVSKVTWVAVCSGNHDNAGRQISPDRAPAYEWLVTVGRESKIVTDGSTHVLDDLIITTVPYHCSKEQKSIWLDRGAVIRRQRGSPWLVLHHVPPIAYPGSTKEEAEAAELLLNYRPEYFISGHSHQFPYFPGSSWAQRIEGVNVVVPGQLLRAPFPNHIILNSESGEVSWETANQNWIPEDECGEHF